jgi:superfamily II DNA or RNA helicase
MGRASVYSDEVKRLQRALVALFLRTGSVNKLCVFLNELLAQAGVSQKLYPNRIHALLSSDVMRAVNAKTLALIEQAVMLSNRESHSADPEFAGSLLAHVEHHWAASSKTRREIQRIASELSVPPAVVEFLLEREGKTAGSLSDAITEQMSADAAGALKGSPRAKGAPDYSFQDVAIKQCRAALRKDVGRRVGLVTPTGSGKTEMGIKIGLQELHDSPRKETKVFWVTHRRNLRTQAHKRLQKMLMRGVSGIPEEAASLLANRFEFIMVREARDRIQNDAYNVALIIVDEAHHAAAGSYDPIFESLPPLPVLALTATPNRTDGLAIRIDEIGFTITYAELVERNVILMPEFVPFPVPQFDWTPQMVEDLADDLISNTNDKYRKVLVITPNIECVEEFYDALVKRLSEEDGHVLGEDDIGFLHSQRNSGHQDSQSFIDAFTIKPRGILVSAQMLLEGFDDPQIDTVVITYKTSSLIALMQAAGRCVRHAPGKNAAYVIQARDDRTAYYFEQRWLYQDISDYARPHLEHINYRNSQDLLAQISAALISHNVPQKYKVEIFEQLKSATPGETFRLLLAGLPYFGETNDFATVSEWTGALLTSETRSLITSAFNEFCARGAALTQDQHLSPIIDDMARRFNLIDHPLVTSLVSFLHNLFISTQNAVREVYGYDKNNYLVGGRPQPDNHSTTWLKYITFEFRPTVPEAVTDFLVECANKTEILSKIEEGQDVALLLRVPLPLIGFEAFALTERQNLAFAALRDNLTALLRNTPGIQQLAVAAGFLAIQDAPEIPNRLMYWMDVFSRSDFMTDNSLSLRATDINQNKII